MECSSYTILQASLPFYYKTTDKKEPHTKKTYKADTLITTTQVKN